MSKFSEQEVRQAYLTATSSIVRDEIFRVLNGPLLHGKSVFDPVRAGPTACTDGWDVWYNPDFFMQLSLPERRGLILHETGHKVWQHLSVWHHLMQRDARLANIAMDHVDNLWLHEMDAGRGFIAIPSIGIQPNPEYHGMSVEQVFNDLLRNPPPQQQQSLDTHAPADISKEEQEQRIEKMKTAVRNSQMAANAARGDKLGKSSGLFGDLLDPKIDPYAILREILTRTVRGFGQSTWRRPNRRFLGYDIYMPGSQAVAAQDLVIGIDTSGSCFGTKTMTRFITELEHILTSVKPRTTHVIYWDSEVTGHQTFTDGRFSVADAKPVGGGGTNGSVLFDYMREKQISASAIIQFSDGDVGSWGDTTVPTIWALTDKRKTAPFGTTIYIGD